MVKLVKHDVDFFELDNKTLVEIPHYFKALINQLVSDNQRLVRQMSDSNTSLINCGLSKVALIKFLREFKRDPVADQTLGLKDAKDIVDLYINNAVTAWLNAN